MKIILYFTRMMITWIMMITIKTMKKMIISSPNIINGNDENGNDNDSDDVGMN